MYDEMREEMAVCNKQSNLEGENCFPKGDELMKMLVAICIIFHFNLYFKYLFRVRHFASQWEYKMNRSQLYLQAAFISSPHI